MKHNSLLKRLPRYYLSLLMVVLAFGILMLCCLGDLGRLEHTAVLVLGLNVACLIGSAVLSFIYTSEIDAVDRNAKLFNSLLSLVFLELFVESISWFSFGVPKLIGVAFVALLIAFLASPVICYIFWLYQISVYGDKDNDLRSPLSKAIFIGLIVDVVLILGLAFTNNLFHISELGEYSRYKGYFLTIIYPGITLIVCAIYDLKKKLPNRQKASLLMFCFMPIFATILSAFIPNYSVTYIFGFFTIMMLYGSVQIDRSLEFNRQSKEITEKQTQLMVSQINPHFIYNTLATIRCLCDSDPELAGRTIDEFSDYLRWNVDGLEQVGPVDIKKEIEHARHYAEIEKLRFDHITVEFDIQCDDFKLPFLSIQPIVENAIRYGIRIKRDGWVKISTFEDDKNYYVVIKDNGVGFDEREVKSEDGRAHVGITNVRQRLKILLNGSLNIESSAETGTKVTMIVPKNGENR